MEQLIQDTASENAEEIDRGIRDTLRGIHLSILGIALGLVKIKADKGFIALGFKSMTAYIIRLGIDSHLDRSSIFNWLYIGEAYVKYKKELELAGFTDLDGLTKLPYLERALKANKKWEVFENIKTMPVREFVSWAKGNREGIDSDEYKYRWVTAERDNSFYLNGKLAVIISSKINRRVSLFLKKLIRIACTALEKEGVIVPVLLRSRREANRFCHASMRLKMQMGIA